mgnify:CR=1 FL=1
MEMDKLGVVTSFIHNIVVYNIPLLYGTVGEIMVEKSGSLNLGVEGIMAVGAIFGYIIGCYTNSLLIGILTAFLAGALCGLLFAALTVSLQANQNITGLTLTTFGLGVYFFVGNGLKAVKWPAMNDYSHIKQGFANIAIPGLSKLPLVGEGLFDHNMLVYLGVVIAIVAWWYLNRTTPGLRLRAVGENPGAADSVGVNVKRFSRLLVLLSSLLAACVTAFAGPISFVGIAVPHLVKQLLGSAKPLVVLPGCCLGGAAFCLLCDLIARSLFAPTELSISAVTAVFGAPVVIGLLIRRNREGAQ